MHEKEELRVRTSDEATRESYGRISKFFGYIEDWAEKDVREKGLELLKPQEGEKILEFGFGTGRTLTEIAEDVGESGKAYGIDVTPEMVERAKERLKTDGVEAEIQVGDVRDMPFESGSFDAVYSACTLELFDTSDIPEVLEECKRVLKEKGRLVIASLCREGHENSKMVGAYEWLHKRFPKLIDCRPIYVRDSIENAGFEIMNEREVDVYGIPFKVAVGKPL